MQYYNSLFLTRVWKHSKPLAIILLLFVAAQFFFTYKGVETFPFMHWGMYSAKTQKPDTLQVVSLNIGGVQVGFSSLSDAQRSFAESSFKRYYELYQTNGKDSIEKVIRQRFKGKLNDASYNNTLQSIANDSIAMAKYPKWFFSYIADMRMLPQSYIKASVIKARYTETWEIDSLTSTTVLQYAAE